MAKTIVAGPNQSMLDIVLMACGTQEGAGAFCRLNDVSISDTPETGTVYQVPEGDVMGVTLVRDAAVLQYMADNKITVATLNLGVCAIVTELEEVLAEYDRLKIGYTTGTGSIAVEYAVTATDAEPAGTDWAVTEDNPLVLPDLAAGTTYRVWLRSKCLGHYSRTAYLDAATLPAAVATVILNPEHKAISGLTGPIYYVLVSKETTFHNEYTLDTLWLSPCKMLWESMADYEADGGAGAVELTASATLMTAGLAQYNTTDTPAPGEDRIYWCDLTAPVVTMTFRDSHSNTAKVAPVIVVGDDYTLKQYLCATMTVETVSATDAEVVVRVTRSHVAITAPGMLLDALSWEYEVGTVTEPDPADPDNDNIMLVTIPTGVLKIGVKTTYTSLGDVTIWPSSYIEYVIEVG